MTEEEFNRTLKELDCVLLDVDYDKFENPLDVAKFIITLNKINERMIVEENEELKAQIEKIKEIMNLNDYCENVYHYLSCELSLYKADDFDCEVCRYTGCSKRLKPCELE